MTPALKLTVPPEAEGRRLDSYVAQSIVEVTRSQVQRWIARGNVTVNGTPRKASFAVTPGEVVEIMRPAPEPAGLVPEPLPLKILYEDEDLLVVDKPAGMVVHPGAGNRSGTLANALAFHLDQLSFRDPLRPGIVHRLDKGTSGVLLVAKNERAHDHLSGQFQKRSVHKVYLALVYGRLDPLRGVIKVPIGRDRRSRVRISTRTTRPREAVTEYEVIRRFRRFTYVRAFPHTGRTHQIRVHFHHLGHPLVGDETYVRRDLIKASPSLPKLDRLFLHATRIELEHPTAKKRVVFESPLPDELAKILLTLGE